MTLPSVQKKVAQRIKASASGSVFVQSYPDRSALNSVTASSVVSNKVAYTCSSCKTPVVASAGAPPHCVVCGTETKLMARASVEIQPPSSMSDLTAVECRSCKSVSLLEGHVVTASAGILHCSVCGTENDYSRKITAAPKAKFLQADGETWGSGSSAGEFSFETARAAAMSHEGAALLFGPTGKVMIVQVPKKLQYLDSNGEEIPTPKEFARKLAVKVAQGAGAILIPVSMTHFKIARAPAGIEASVDVTAAKLKFLKKDAETWSTSDADAGMFSFEDARAAAMLHEGSGLLLNISGKVSIVQAPKRPQYLDKNGEPTKTPVEMARKDAVRLAKGSENTVLIPVSYTHFTVAVLPSGSKASTEVVAAAKIAEFMSADGAWTTYSDAKEYAPGFARSLVLESEEAVMVPQPSGRVLVAKIPGGYTKLKFADMSGEPVSADKAASFKLHTALSMAVSLSDDKVTGVLVPVGYTDFQIALFKGGVVNASVTAGTDEWPFDVEAENDKPVEELVDVEASGDELPAAEEEFKFDDEEMGIQSDAMPAEPDLDELDDLDDLGDDSAEDDSDDSAEDDSDDVEMVDLDEPEDKESAGCSENQAAHPVMEVPDVPESAGSQVEPTPELAPSNTGVPEYDEGESIADLLDIDDSGVGLSFEVKSNRVVAMKNYVAVASLTKDGAGQNADIMRSPAFLQAALSMAKSAGMRQALASVGFKMIKVPVMSKVTVARKVNEAMQASANKLAQDSSTLSESMAIAAAGLARGRWRGKENPLLASFANELNSLGIRNTERVVARILASSLVPFTKTLMEVASDLNKMSPAARKETAAVLEMTTELDQIEPETVTAKNELEDRFQTTAAVLRATLPVSGSRSVRQSNVVASAHSAAMAILNGDQPLVLGQ
jgi:hypothetical protein